MWSGPWIRIEVPIATLRILQTCRPQLAVRLRKSTGMLRHIVLVGLMVTGKTTVGSGLAAALGWPFSDSDAWIERQRGKTVRALADEIGVDEMHALEAGHLLQAL